MLWRREASWQDCWKRHADKNAAIMSITTMSTRSAALGITTMSITTMSMKSAVMSITTVMGNAAVMTIAMSITMRTRYYQLGRETRISTRRKNWTSC